MGLHLPLFLAFIAAASLLAITPGVDTAIVLRTAATSGPRPALMAALGVGLGCLVWGGAVSLGLGALLRAAPLAYDAVKYAGAAYLLWLGLRLLRHPRESMGGLGEDRARAGAFRRGLLTNLLNPKVGVFYVTFLPQFIPQGAPVAAWSFLLAATHVALSLVWFALLIAATAPLQRCLRCPGIIRALDRLTGCVFIGFGLKLAVTR